MSGDGLVTHESFEWCHPDFQLAPIHELVIYELHPATFAGTPDDSGELGDRHQLHTIHTDVVYNHLGPSDLDLWRFDGFRLDSTVNIRNAKGEEGPDGNLDDGWRLIGDLPLRVVSDSTCNGRRASCTQLGRCSKHPSTTRTARRLSRIHEVRTGRRLGRVAHRASRRCTPKPASGHRSPTCER